MQFCIVTHQRFPEGEERECGTCSLHVSRLGCPKHWQFVTERNCSSVRINMSGVTKEIRNWQILFNTD